MGFGRFARIGHFRPSERPTRTEDRTSAEQYGRLKQVDDEDDLPHFTLQMHQKDARSP